MLRRNHRREEGAFLLEGARAIRDVLASGGDIEELFVVADEWPVPGIVVEAASRPVVHLVTPSVLAAITDSVTPQGIVAVARSPLAQIEDVRCTSGLAVVLAGVGDPGNVGTIIRTAAAAAADCVILAAGTCDVLNPKTARAATSALFSVPIVADIQLVAALDRLATLGYATVGTDASAPASMYDRDLSRPVALVVGNEARGLPSEQQRQLDEVVSIPMPGPVESLNVATAAALVVFEVLRQRRLSFGPEGGSQ
ncbi:MAG TPA: RNA methyltransferase [Actinomycetota bacterium]|nr:RNA methyltransferase [Actinomycetota bacterium]